MRVGTKTVLFGYHAFWLHPFMVALAWKKLYGFPYDPRLWVAFFVHDIGYLFKKNIDGVEGQSHPFAGAQIMHFLFDWNSFSVVGQVEDYSEWYKFCLYHSRTLALCYFGKLSRLCFADKLAFMYYPKSLMKFLYTLSGECKEYYPNYDFEAWHHKGWLYNATTLKNAGFSTTGDRL